MRKVRKYSVLCKEGYKAMGQPVHQGPCRSGKSSKQHCIRKILHWSVNALLLSTPVPGNFFPMPAHKNAELCS